MKAEINQACVLLVRQLEQESRLLNQLQQLCDSFGGVVKNSTSGQIQPIDLSDTQLHLDQLSQASTEILQGREQVISRIRKFAGTEDWSIGRFLSVAPEPFKQQISSMRNELRRKMFEIKARFRADSTVVFHSFDFYRRIVDGLVNQISEEKNYDQHGNKTSVSSGRLFEKAY